MAPIGRPRGRPKRKRTLSDSPLTKKNKKPRKSSRTDEAADEEYYPALRICDENRKTGQYLIEWEGIDPATGDPFAPTWHPYENANAALVSDWEARKAEERAAKKRTPDSSSPVTRPGRRRRAILEEKDTNDNPTSKCSVTTSPTDIRCDSLSNSISTPHTSSIQLLISTNGSSPPDAQPRADIRLRSNSPTPGQTIASTRASAASQRVDTDDIFTSPTLNASARVAPRLIDIVPDSQDVHVDSSYVPSTQTNSNSYSHAHPQSSLQTVSTTQSAESLPSPQSPRRIAACHYRSAVVVSPLQDDSPPAAQPTFPQTISPPSTAHPSPIGPEVSGNQQSYELITSSTQSSLPRGYQLIPQASGRRAADVSNSDPSQPSSPDQQHESHRRSNRLSSRSAEPTSRPVTSFSSDTHASHQAASEQLAAMADIRFMSAAPGFVAVGNPPYAVRSAEDVSAPAVEVAAPTDSSSSASSPGDLSRILEEPEIGRCEYVVSLPLFPQARSEYRNVLNHKNEVINEYLEQPRLTHQPLPDDVDRSMQQLAEVNVHTGLTASIDYNLRKLADVNVHTDLALPISSQDPALLKELFNHHDTVSSKFVFLIEMFRNLRGESSTVVLVARPGKLTDMLSQLMEHMDFGYTRLDTGYSKVSPENPCQVVISAADHKMLNMHATSSQDTVIVAVDETLFGSELYRGRESVPAEQLCPLVSLVVVNSLEHVTRCLPATMTVDRQWALVALARGCLRTVGRLPNDLNQREEKAAVLRAGAHVGQFVRGRVEWALPTLGEVDFSGGWVHQLPFFTNANAKDLSQLETSGFKRVLEPEDEVPSKRARTASHGESQEQAEITHISDSVGKLSQPQQHDPTAEPINAAIAQRVTELEALLDATRARLRRAEDTAESYELLEKGRQDEARAHKTELARTTKELARTEAKLAELTQRVERQATLLALKSDEIRSLKGKVDELAHPLPDRRATADEDLARARARAEAALTEAAYLRERYQEASTAAAERAAETSVLHAELATLRPRAEGQMVEARRVSHEYARSVQKQALAQLQLRVRHLEDAVRRKDAVIAQLKERNVGVGTRAGSVPRSPRIGGQGGSRAASPLPGGRIGMLRDGGI